MSSRREERAEKMARGVVNEILLKAGLGAYKGNPSEDAPKEWTTLMKIIGTESTESSRVSIKCLEVIGTDEDHTIFGLGSDNVPYVWQDGKWIPHA